jgi:hypothetical protein
VGKGQSGQGATGESLQESCPEEGRWHEGDAGKGGEAEWPGQENCGEKDGLGFHTGGNGSFCSVGFRNTLEPITRQVHRPSDRDAWGLSSHPKEIEFSVLRSDGSLWAHSFRNYGKIEELETFERLYREKIASLEKTSKNAD